jgi:bifunctional DNA-binding transcriptional regulator/antitoxin component of YhaV-PrlF toxin-antitoxin module
MLTKRTSKNQVTTPKAVRAKLESLGLTEQDIVEAVLSVRGRATMPARRVSTLRRNGHR